MVKLREWLPLVLGIAVAAPAAAQVQRWDFRIDASQVRNGDGPGGTTDSPGTGFGHFVYDPATSAMHYTISWSGLQGDLTGLYVNGPAGPDESTSSHLLAIFDSELSIQLAGVDRRNDSWSASFPVDDTATTCSEMDPFPCYLEDRAYVSVETTADPTGEIRGHFVSGPPLLVWRFASSEDQVKNGDEPDGSTNSPGSGDNTLRVDVAAGQLHYRIGWRDLEGDLTKLHVHGPAGPDESNPLHLFEIFDSVQEILDAMLDPRNDDVEGSFPIDVLDTECSATKPLPCLLEERAYVNVHSQVDPTGEIRGNAVLIPHPYVWEFPISEDQVKNGNEPDGSTNSPASGHGLFEYDAFTETMSYEISWDGLEGDLTKLHVHGPAGPEESTPAHLFEIFDTVQEILDAGLDRTSDTTSLSVPLALGAVACTELDALPCYLEERGYVNVHTTVDPTGEIRGNLRLVPEPLHGPGAALVGLAALGRRRARRRPRSAGE